MISDNPKEGRKQLTELLKKGEADIFGVSLENPFYLDNGGFSDIFKNGDDIIRISEEPSDHFVNLLAKDVSVFPRIHHSFLVNNNSVTIRDDIESAGSKYHKELGVCLPEYYFDSDEDILAKYPKHRDMPRYMESYPTFLNCISKMILHNDDADSFNIGMRALRTAYNDYCVDGDKTKLRNRVPEIFDEMLKGFSHKNRVYTRPFHNAIKYNPDNGDVSVGNRTNNFTGKFLMEALITMTEIVIQNKHRWPVWRKIVDFCEEFTNETGIVPLDISSSNLGVDGDEIIFRDPYYFAFKHKDYQICVGQHRIRKGLHVPEEWDIHPKVVDVVPVLLSHPENSKKLIQNGMRAIARRVDTKTVLDFLSENVPVANLERYIFEPTLDDVKFALNAMRITESNAQNVVAPPAYLQKTPPRLKYLDDALEDHHQRILDSIVVCAQKLKKAGLEHIMDEFFSICEVGGQIGKLQFEASSNNRLTDDCVEALNKNSEFIARRELPSIFTQAYILIRDVYRLTGHTIESVQESLVIEDGNVKIGVYTLPERAENEIVERVLSHINTPSPKNI